ncbi:glycine-rich domain-containing protein [Lachnospiraceae bacterium 62-35]
MAIAILMKGGGSGSGSDDVTASKAQVLQGYTAVTSDSDDEPAAGTMPNRGTNYQTPRNVGWDTSRGILWMNIEKGYYGDPSGDNNYVWKDIAAARSQLGITAGKILAGQNIGGLAGTATSDANASAGYIYSGKTAYVNGTKITGSMSVSSLVSFSTATYSTTQITASWQWPWAGPYSGIAICGKTGGYPDNIWDSRVYTGHGNNYNLGASTSVIIGGLQPGQTYYFRAWLYCTTSAGDLYSGYKQATAATKPQGQQVFTSSGTFTVPANIYSIDVFCVGGGGAGGRYYSASDGKQFGGAGGGGGYTSTRKNIAVSPGQSYAVTVGSGGIQPGSSYDTAAPGGTSSFGSILTANGGEIGKEGNRLSFTTHPSGGAGGSGGGGGLKLQYDADGNFKELGIGGNGGSDGGNGGAGGTSTLGTSIITNGPGGTGQGTTTRAFGDSNGTLYSGGGGGSSYYTAGGQGGSGGGGNANSAGAANTGGGGGGSSVRGGNSAKSGGSGIVIVRWGY